MVGRNLAISVVETDPLLPEDLGAARGDIHLPRH